MVQQRINDRLQPALLDRLNDDDPTNLLESPDMRVINKARLREHVLRDLSWMFNTTQMSNDESLAACPAVKRSVLNYGLPPLSGQTTSSLNASDLETKVKQAILDFEPRILAHTLEVEAIVSGEQLDHHNQISFRIAGQIWAQPVPIEMLLQTKVDLETGLVEVRDVGR